MSHPRASTATVTVAVDAGSRDVSAADHVAHLLADRLAGDPATYVCSTHVVATPTPHLVVVASWEDVKGSADSAGGVTTVLEELPRARALVRRGLGETVLGPDGLDDSVRGALEEHRTRAWGRLVVFPGSAEVRGRVSVAQVVAGTCVEEVTGLAGLDLADETVLDLGDFYRPTWSQGRCTLLVQAASTAPVPFEARDQIACCADH